ncbi:MAG: ACT domain-containing protein [Lachnospiraceae bacterium]
MVISREVAKQHGCDLMFEAAVAGAIPVITPLKQSLAANHLTEVMGIVNGTTNFILTKMAQEGMEFWRHWHLRRSSDMPRLIRRQMEETRRSPQQGGDSGIHRVSTSCVSWEDVSTEGITGITANDIRYAKEMGCCIKLIGMAHSEGEGIEAYVAPMLIPLGHPLSTVNDSYNAVFVRGDAVDNAMFLGRGAGELPTASAVAGDVFEVMRNLVHGCCGRVSCTCATRSLIVPMEEVRSRYFLRVLVEDKIGVLAMIANEFAGHRVSVQQMIQKERINDCAEIVVITDRVCEGDFKKAVHCIAEKPNTRKVEAVIRVYGE